MHCTSLFMSSKRVSQIFKILFQTGDINIFVLRSVFFSRYVQLKSSSSDSKKHQRWNLRHNPANIRWSSRRLEDVFKTCLEDVLKTYLEDVFKTSRRQAKFLLVISVSNKSKCVCNKSLFHKLYLKKLRRIQIKKYI